MNGSEREAGLTDGRLERKASCLTSRTPTVRGEEGGVGEGVSGEEAGVIPEFRFRSAVSTGGGKGEGEGGNCGNCAGIKSREGVLWFL